eukprot:COSAG06_NODE_51854_length_309_cov_1.004762_1_plen_43_part_10
MKMILISNQTKCPPVHTPAVPPSVSEGAYAARLCRACAGPCTL